MDRRVVVQSRNWDGSSTPLTSLTRSIICHEWCSLCSSLRLLRVMHEVEADLRIIYQQFNLRFISSYASDQEVLPDQLSSSISLFWNLQTLYISSSDVYAPSEIWKMRQLRHIECNGIIIPTPPPSDDTVLLNLQTLKRIHNFSFSEEACKRMPNIKDLEVTHYDSRFDHCHYNLVRLNKVESLYYCVSSTLLDRDRLARDLSFPLALKNLSLSGCRIHCNDLSMIGSLPHLKTLSLLNNAVMGPEWNPVEGGFLRLKLLEIYECYDLICWGADGSHFPVLEKLILDDSKLNEIPPGIGEIPTLKSVWVNDGSCSLAVSAARLLEERESLGDDVLQVRVDFYYNKIYDEFKEWVKDEVLTSLNLLLRTPYR